LFAPRIYIFVLRAHPVRGESHNQRNATGGVATISPKKWRPLSESKTIFALHGMFGAQNFSSLTCSNLGKIP